MIIKGSDSFIIPDSFLYFQMSLRDGKQAMQGDHRFDAIPSTLSRADRESLFDEHIKAVSRNYYSLILSLIFTVSPIHPSLSFIMPLSFFIDDRSFWTSGDEPSTI